MKGTVNHEARAEDIRWFVETGENLTGAARRLGISVDGVEKWCRLHGMRNEWQVLQDREPFMPADRREINRRNADARWAS